MRSRLLTTGVAISLLTGCAAISPNLDISRHINSVGEAVGLGGLPKEMQYTNHIARVVFEDERSFHSAGIRATADMKAAGIRWNSEPAARYRAVALELNNWDSPWLLWFSGALVADQIPLLKDGDTVEVRMLAPVDSIRGFTGTQDVPVVFRLVCRGDISGHDTCRDALPGHPSSKHVKDIPTRTPFAKHWNEMGLTLTPRYGPDNEILPDAPMPPARPTAS